MSNPYESPQFASPPIINHSKLQLARRLTRLLANIVDSIIMFAISLPAVGVIVYLLAPNNILGFMQTWTYRLIALPLGMGLFLLVNGYFLARDGQTLGKKLLGIKIVRSNGDPATLGRILGLRILPLVLIVQIPCVGAVVAIVDALMIFRENHKCLHDEIADTIVIMA